MSLWKNKKHSAYGVYNLGTQVLDETLLKHRGNVHNIIIIIMTQKTFIHRSHLTHFPQMVLRISTTLMYVSFFFDQFK